MDLNQHLIDLADQLDSIGKYNCADAVDNLLQSQSLVKISQYVGVIGYVLKQNRAMANCIRKKRASSNQSIQESVLACLKEYQDGQSYDDTLWHEKYAQQIRRTPAKFSELHLDIIRECITQSEIEKHRNQLEKTAILLHQHGTHDDIIDKMISHIETLSDIVEKEINH